MNKLTQVIIRLKTAFIWIMLLVLVILSPIIGKGVENTTKALLPGLSTEDQIITVAEAVDNNKLILENKIAEQKAIIDNQSVEILEQQQIIDEQKALVEKNNNTLSNESECRKLYMSNPECKSDVYRTKSAFDAYIKEEDARKPNNYRNTYSICQNIISKCD